MPPQTEHKSNRDCPDAAARELHAFANSAMLARTANCAAVDALYRLHACRLKHLAAAIPPHLLSALVPLLWPPASTHVGILRAALCRIVLLVSECSASIAADAASTATLVAVAAAASQHCFLADVSWRMHGSASLCADPTATVTDVAAPATPAGPDAGCRPQTPTPSALPPVEADTPAASCPATPARRSSRIQSNPTTPTPAKPDKRRKTPSAAQRAASAQLLTPLPEQPAARGSPGLRAANLSDDEVYSTPLQPMHRAALLLVDACAAMHWCARAVPGHHRASYQLAKLFLAGGRPELARMLLGDMLCSPADKVQFTPEALRPSPGAVASQPTAKAVYPDATGMSEVTAGLQLEGGVGKYPCEEVTDVKHAARLGRCVALYIKACRSSGAVREAAAVLRWGLATNWGSAIANMADLGHVAGAVLLADLAAAAAAAAAQAEVPGDGSQGCKAVLEAAWQVNALLGGDGAKWAEAAWGLRAAQELPAEAQAVLGGPVCQEGVLLVQQACFQGYAKV